MKISESDLKPFKLSDKEQIVRLIAENPNDSCEDSFATLALWNKVYNYKIYHFEEVIFVYNSVIKLLHFPFGKFLPPEKLSLVARAFDLGGLIASDVKFLYNVPPKYLEAFPNASEFFNFEENPADADYLYSVEKLIESSGPKLRKKRNHIKHFMKDCPDYMLEPVTEKNLNRAVRFLINTASEQEISDEVKIFETLPDLFCPLNLQGAMLHCSMGTIIAAAIFSVLNSTTCVVHFEKSLHDVNGASQMIVAQEAVSIKALGLSLMNREQDLGLENLRKAKESLDPIAKYKRLRAHFK